MVRMDKRTAIFEEMPARRAVLTQILPAIASQMITLAYNLADTYFVGMLNEPVQTAAITVAYPPFIMLSIISSLFGIGGASAIARALGRKENEKATQISSLAFWGGLICGILFSVLIIIFANPLLTVCGAKADTYPVIFGYVKWAVIIGGPCTILNMALSHLVRSDGSALHASLGVSLGCVLNIILDPIFVLPQFLGLKAAGAAMATAISNAVAALYLFGYIILNKNSILSVRLRHLKHAGKHIGEVLSIGLPSSLQHALTVVAVAAQAKFVSAYPTEAVAALGIVKKLDQLPLFFSVGVSTGLLPLLAYNHSSGNFERRRQCFRFGALISLSFSILCVALYESLAPRLVGLFIDDKNTVSYGATFLRLMVTAMPMMSLCHPLITQFQAMGRPKESLICSLLRKGMLDIPLLFIMDAVLPLYGCMLVQPIVDFISLIVAGTLYFKVCASKNESSLSL